MSLLPRRARARETTAPVLPPEQAARLQAQIDDPDVGFLRRRALHRQLLGIRAIGPSGPPAPEPAPDAAPGGDALAMPPGGSDAHYTAVVAEVHALDRHAAEIDARLAALANSDSVEAHELRAERQQITMLRAELLGRDEKVDLAVLRVKPKAPLKAVNFGDSDKTRVGEWVIAIGNPFGLGGSVTVGVVSARNRNIDSSLYDDFIQTDAAINRGNSGGPLFNLQGEVIGINTAIYSQTGGSIGIGFAIPANTVMPLIKQLRETGEIQRGWIGVSIQAVDDQIAESLGLPSARGALIAAVGDNGPAQKSGMLAGDVVIRFNGQEVREMRNLPRIVAGTEIGKTVDVVVIRKGKEQTLKLQVAKLADSDKKPSKQTKAEPEPKQKQQKQTQSRPLGLELAAVSEELRRRYRLREDLKGLVVTNVDPDSNAADQNVQAGVVLLEVSGEPVTTAAEMRARVDALKKAGKKSALLLLLTPGGEQRFVAVAIP